MKPENSSKLADWGFDVKRFNLVVLHHALTTYDGNTNKKTFLEEIHTIWKKAKKSHIICTLLTHKRNNIKERQSHIPILNN